jgi:uncharacterized protein with ParB-like and HNH nuclease domain
MKIEASELTVRELFCRPNNVYDVPVYQRPYSWGESQWQELWDDVISVEEEDTHYLGSIVVISKNASLKGFDELEIVDGQQRLTTLSILFCAIRDAYHDGGEENVADDLQKDYLYSRQLRHTARKLNLGKVDDEVYEKLLKRKLTPDTTICSAWTYFRERLNEHPNLDEVMEKFSASAQVVIINTHSYDNAFKLFETLNDRGLQLSAADLIKNCMLSKAAAEDDAALEDVILAWEGLVGDLENIDIIRFLRQYLLATDTGKVSKAKLYNAYKTKLDTEKDVVGYVNRLSKAAKLYRLLHEPVFQSEKLNRKILDLHHLRAIPSLTLLLRLLIEEWTESDILEVIPDIEAFALRRSTCGWSTGEMDTINNQIANLPKTQLNAQGIREKLKASIPGDDEFRVKFANNIYRQNDQTRYILEMFEQDLVQTNEKHTASSQTVHIEHIMPQTITSKKSLKTQGGDWVSYLGDEAERHYENHRKIGNLTLLAQELNIPASNNPFEAKKTFYEQSQFSLTKELCGKIQWKESDINSRSNVMADRAVAIWNLR